MKLSLSDLLQSIRIPKVDAAFVELGIAAGVRFAPSEHAFLHIALEGDVTLDTDRADVALDLQTGDYAIVLSRRVHTIRTSAGLMATTSEYFNTPHAHDSPPTLRFGAGRRGAYMLSGAFRLPPLNPLIRALPIGIITGNGAGPGSAQIGFNLASLATTAVGPGASAILTSAFNLLLVNAVRRELTSLFPEGLEFAASSAHLRIPIALSLIHAHLERNWSLAGLAGELGISRSAFAAEFTSVVGQPLMRHITGLRMMRASEMLRWQPVEVAEVAWQTGYESLASFTRAFRKYFNTTPVAFQKDQAPRFAGAVAGHMHWAPFLTPTGATDR